MLINAKKRKNARNKAINKLHSFYALLGRGFARKILNLTLCSVY